MICKRIISVLTFNKGCLYRTKEFKPDYPYTSNFLDFWWADEIVALDITRDNPIDSKYLFYEALNKISGNCFVPLAAGGGLKTLEDVDKLFELGVDKVVVNTHAIDDPKFITQIANKYGSQAVVLSIDARKSLDSSSYTVYKGNGEVQTSLTPCEWGKMAVSFGAGEIMINSIAEDGSLNGYDEQLCCEIVDHVNVPVLICGGAGNWKHFEKGFLEIGADAVCTNNIFHFTEASMQSAKSFLQKKNIAMRL
jgi:cyclase